MRSLGLAIAIVGVLVVPAAAQWNPFGGGPKIIAPNGRYLGRLNANPFDPDSVANPFGRYGSLFSPDSINNPFGRYGSQFSPDGVRNPYSTGGPFLPGDD